MAKKTNPAPHVMVEALAGTGKTTTIIGGVKAALGGEPFGDGRKASPQQKAVFAAMAKEKPRSVRCVSFNRAIADELARRVPTGVESGTHHTTGLSFLRGAAGRVRIEGRKTDLFLRNEYPRLEWEDRKMVEKIVSACKGRMMTLPDVTEEGVVQVCAERDIGNGDANRLAPMAVAALKNAYTNFGTVDFDDMIWLPIILKMTRPAYDLIVVDESQDLDPMQQELHLRIAKRVVVVGDSHQAIYAFRGADSASMQTLSDRLAASDRGLVTLPLSVTYRCPKAVVALAQQIVPGFTAHESAPEGKIIYKTSKDALDQAQGGDFIVCRLNAPIISAAFGYLKQDRPCRIQGRDFGEDLTRLVRKLAEKDMRLSIGTWSARLDGYYRREMDRLMKANASEGRMSNLTDKVDCLNILAEGASIVQDILNRIQKLFSEESMSNQIVLSSIHRAKGLESDRVIFLLPEIVPLKWAKTPAEVQQEWNLKYVAITRAKDTLVLASKSV